MNAVATTGGSIEGVQREGHLAFYGLPFAADAGGANRFRAPQPAERWSGVRSAKDIGLASRQTTHPIPGFAASGPQGEDCLNLNVFTPAADAGRRPVLFWIHGGGFTHGTGSDALYDGGPLARRGDAVVVTINYRLGALGYLYLEHHLPGQGLAANAGQLDQVAALEWVRDNIESFGGDPGNVTIFGESAGSMAVGALLAMPAARGLFRRAIMQSGAGRATSAGRAAEVTSRLLEELGLRDEEAEKLLRLPDDEIVAAQTRLIAKTRTVGMLPFGPVLDPGTLPESPIDATRAGRAAPVPLVIGTNRDEYKLFAAGVQRDEPDGERLLRDVCAAVPGASEQQAAELVEVYRRSRRTNGLRDGNLDIADAIRGDVIFRGPAGALAEAHRAQGHDVFAYLFTYGSPARRGALGACHALELPFVFGTLGAPTQDRFAGTGPEVDGLSANMQEAWLGFAREGIPAHEGIGRWDAYDSPRRPTMLFDRHSGQQDDPLGEELAAIRRVLGG